VEHERAREPTELQCPMHFLLTTRSQQTGGDDRTAGTGGGGDACAGLARERHAQTPKAESADSHAGCRVAELYIAVRVLCETDRDESPVELIAVTPAKHGEGRRG